jgi:hypothetical protein
LESGGLNRRYEEYEIDLVQVSTVPEVHYEVRSRGDQIGDDYATLEEAKSAFDSEVEEYNEHQDEQEHYRKKKFGCDGCEDGCSFCQSECDCVEYDEDCEACVERKEREDEEVFTRKREEHLAKYNAIMMGVCRATAKENSR